MTDSTPNKLIPGAALIHECVDGVIYTRYRDPPYNQIERWISGGDPDAVANANGELLSYFQWQEIFRLSEENPTLKKQLDQLLNTYYIIKDQK